MTSERYEERKLEFLEQVARIVKPIEATLENQRAILNRLDAAAKLHRRTVRLLIVGILFGAIVFGAMIYGLTLQQKLMLKTEQTLATVRDDARAAEKTLKGVEQTLAELRDVKNTVSEAPTVEVVPERPAYPGAPPKAKVVIKKRESDDAIEFPVALPRNARSVPRQ